MKRSRATTLEPISAAMFVIVSVHAGLVFAGWWWWQNNHARNGEGAESSLTWMSPADFKSQLPSSSASPAAASNHSAPNKKTSAPSTAARKNEEPPVQKATLVAAPPQQTPMEAVPNTGSAPLFAPATPPAKPSANRSITLRRAQERPVGQRPFGSPAPPMASPTLLDVARLNTLRPPPAQAPVAQTEPVTDEAELDAVDEAVNAAFLAAWTAPPIDAVPSAQREARLNISIGKDGAVLRAQMSKFSRSHVLDQSILETAARVKKISTALPSNFTKESYDLELNFILLP